MFFFKRLQDIAGIVSAALGLALLLAACAPHAPKPSPGHLQAEAPISQNDIPPPVTHAPYIPPPDSIEEPELYTVVVDGVPIRELLFSLARETNLNVDIHPGVSGNVTLNAIDQTLLQILQRISRQAAVYYTLQDDNLIIMPDTPHVRYYQIDYLNIDRTTKNSISIQTQVSSGGGGGGEIGGGAISSGNDSQTTIDSTTENKFWENLQKNIALLISGDAKDVAAHQESGLLIVRASAREHEMVQEFLDRILLNVQRQVLIEASIVEIRLNDRYQAGVDWQRIAGSFTYSQNTLAGNFSGGNGYYFGYADPTTRIGDISTAVRLLSEYGAVKVLSSPKLMALNNQPAILKVVDNRVYFVVNVSRTEGTQTNAPRETFETEVRTVPEGLILTVTPQISENDAVILNIRPTISRIISYATDPSPALADVGVSNRIPEVQVREIESILKLQSGHVAIIGGLMQDSGQRYKNGVPGLSDLPLVGDAFAYRFDDYQKTELAIFLRPLVVKDPSLSGDLRPYKVFLPNSEQGEPAPLTSFPINSEAYYPEFFSSPSASEK